MEAGDRAAVIHRQQGGSGSLATGLLSRYSPPTILFAIALLASGVLLSVWQAHLTFSIDDWDLLLHRRGFNAHVFLEPHVRHIIIGPAITYKAIQATFGMDSLLPYAVASISMFLASAVVLFIYLRRRVGEWLALAGVLPILFMGSAYEDLLSPFQLCYFGSMAFGIGALLALERRDPRGDAIACGLLIVSTAYSEIGLAFAVGAAVAIALDRGPLQRGYVVAGPLLFYAAWYVGFETGNSDLSFHGVATSPSYVLDGLAGTLRSLLGFGNPLGIAAASGLDLGRALLAGLVAAAAIWVPSRGRISSWLLVIGAIVLTFWFLTAANAGLYRPVTAARYQYVGAVFLLLLAAECARGIRPRPGVVAGALAISALATLSNFSALQQSYVVYHRLAQTERAAFAGLEIAAPRVDPGLLLDPQNSDTEFFNQLDAGPYLSAVSKFGSPAYTESDLAGAPDAARIAADKVLAAAVPISLTPTSTGTAPSGGAPRVVSAPGSAISTRGSCLTIRPTRGAVAILSLPPGGAAVRISPNLSAALALRRFASSFSINGGRVSGATRLNIPTDLSRRPWELRLTPTGPVTVCGAA
jgi:uncharacterized membrane protein